MPNPEQTGSNDGGALPPAREHFEKRYLVIGADDSTMGVISRHLARAGARLLLTGKDAERLATLDRSLVQSELHRYVASSATVDASNRTKAALDVLGSTEGAFDVVSHSGGANPSGPTRGELGASTATRGEELETESIEAAVVLLTPPRDAALAAALDTAGPSATQADVSDSHASLAATTTLLAGAGIACCVLLDIWSTFGARRDPELLREQEQQLRRQLRELPRGPMRINALAARALLTEEEALEAQDKGQPLPPRALRAADVAVAVAALLGEPGRFLNAQLLVLDGT